MTPPPSQNASDGFEAAFAQVRALAETFSAGSKHYLSASYQEQEARQDFIDKFWTALGWDVHHSTQTDPYAQEVKVERSVTMSEGRKRADYAFYLGPDFKNPRFFVEAKKPSVEIANRDSYFQALRYGWNGGTPLAVLTDFEQFHVLDCRARPDVETALSHAVQKYHYEEYKDRDKFGAIYWLFSREAVAAGRLDAFVQTQMPKAGGKFLQRGLFHGGHQGIDESFLRELDEYRRTLARAFHAANPGLDSETLTECTQRVLDRLVFLRFLEDKLIEPEPLVAHFGDRGSAWAGFLKASRDLDRVYNGNIFKPHLIDRPTFHAPDAVFGQICSDLSSEQSPYLFSLIPIHILGSIYERFLGKVIVVEGDTAQVEEKPEVRKAGGVYYTPDYIVRYIVDHTVGTQIEGKTPAEIAPLRFADIACGSGSFLLGVYDALLRYHTAYYNAKAKGRTQEARKAGCEEREGVWHLSLWQKRQILLNNVWGVDIDAQAVEVAQMSLYLKLLEEETTATAHDQNTLHGAILPTLTQNIVFGNSLIGTDILQDTLFEPAEERKLNPLDFKQAFPQIMKNGGFDAIVGNPPWVDIKGMDPVQVRYFFDNYATVENRMNIYAVFMEKAVNILKPNALLGYITPSSFLTQSSYSKLRSLLLKYQLKNITRTPDKVFKGVVAETTVFFLGKNVAAAKTQVLVYPANAILTEIEKASTSINAEIDQSEWLMNDSNMINLYVSREVGSLLMSLENAGQELLILCEFSLGLTPYDKYKGHTKEQISGRQFHSKEKLSDDYKPLIEGEDVGRYFTGSGGREFIKYGSWLGASREKRFFTQPRILVRQIISGNPGRIYATYTNKELYNAQIAFNLLVRDEVGEKPFYILGIINSRLLTWFHRQKYLDPGKTTFQKILIQDAKKFPIRRIDFSDPTDKARHDQMVQYVEQILAAKKQRADALTDRDTEYWQRRCDTLDRQIDELVYELYGLTDEEIALVEGATASA